MKITIKVLIFYFLVQSCHSQDFNVNYENIEINIPGTPGPWLKYNGKYYCYFQTDKDKFSSGSNHNFYIIDKNGKIDSRISVPDKLQTYYYDLYIKYGTIFTTQYNHHYTFYLDEKRKKWIETNKGIDLYYEDKDYLVYSLDFGEWGGVTWFKDRHTGKQYEVQGTSPIVNRFNDTYYLTTSHSIMKIEDPKRLELSKSPYSYKKAVLDKRYFREGSYSTKGAEIIYRNESDDYFNPQFSIATSFISNNTLYHLYKDSIATKIAVIQDKKLVPVYSFKPDIRPFKWHYDTRSPIQNNNYQTVQFVTDDKNVFGIIEINGENLNVTYFKNLYQEPIHERGKMETWFENTFDFYHSNFAGLFLSQIESIEQNVNATNITLSHKLSHYLLDGKDVQAPKIYRKIEDSSLSVLTMYYYTTKEKSIELIDFEWGKNRTGNQGMEDAITSSLIDPDIKSMCKTKFDWLSNFLQQKLGEPNSNKQDKKGAKLEWVKKNKVVKLLYNENTVELTMYKK